MRISSSVEYGMRLMVALARQPGRLSAESLSTSENIPRDYVDQILQRLRKAGLVASHRGAAGGYTLSRTPKEISVGDVVRAMEAKVFEEPCERFASVDKDCHHQGVCGIRPVWRNLGTLIEGYLDEVTLERLLEPETATIQVRR